MKYKIGDRVKIKSREWYEKNLDDTCSVGIFVSPMAEYCGAYATITKDYGDGFYKIDLDNSVYNWCSYMFEYSTLDNVEKPHISEQLIKDIAEVIKSRNLGVSVSENEGKLVIEPLRVAGDLVEGAYVMVTNDINNELWTLRQYLSNGYCSAFRTDSFCLPPMKFKYIIELDKFNPYDIEESLKYNIAK